MIYDASKPGVNPGQSSPGQSVPPPAIPGSGSSTHRGAFSLLNECVELKKGESLLIVEEEVSLGYYDHEAPESVEQAARTLGARVEVLEVPGPLDFQETPEKFLQKIAGFDHVVFFSRIGDQIRFANNAQLPDITMVYTLGYEMLESNFGTACYRGMLQIKEAIDDAFLRASEVTVTCPLGTRLSGKPQWPHAEHHDVTIKRFPMLVPVPVPCEGLRGSVVISRFLIGTGAHEYAPYTVMLDNDVKAEIENSRIIRFSGDTQSCQRVEQHYDHVASLFDIDPYYAHSWHAGIHPGCSYLEPAQNNLQRWSGAAFGNPRLMHVHTCGNYAPGEISLNIVDPTISVDGVLLWEEGRLYPWRLPACCKIFTRHPHLEALFSNPDTEIGL